MLQIIYTTIYRVHFASRSMIYPFNSENRGMHITMMWLCANTNNSASPVIEVKTSIADELYIPEFSTLDNFVICETSVSCHEIFNRRFQIYICMYTSLITGIPK